MTSTETPERVGGGKCGVFDSILAQIGTDPIQNDSIKVPKSVWIVEIPPDKHWFANFNDLTYGKGKGLVGFRTKKSGEHEIFKASKSPSTLRELVKVTFDQAKQVAEEQDVFSLLIMESDGSFDVIDFRNG